MRCLAKVTPSKTQVQGPRTMPIGCSPPCGETPFRSSILVEDQEQRETSKWFLLAGALQWPPIWSPTSIQTIQQGNSKLFFLGSDPFHLEKYKKEMQPCFVVSLSNCLVVRPSENSTETNNGFVEAFLSYRGQTLLGHTSLLVLISIC